MEIVLPKDDLAYLKEAFYKRSEKPCTDRPKLRLGMEVEMNKIFQMAKDVFIPSIMQHLERAGVRQVVTPSRYLSGRRCKSKDGERFFKLPMYRELGD